MEFPLFTLHGAEATVYILVALLIAKLILWFAGVVMDVLQTIPLW